MRPFHLLHDDIYCIDAAYMRNEMVSIYLLRDGDEVAFIDTGTQHSMNNVLTTLSDLNIDKSQVKYVIPTHVHLDHAGGAGTMMQLFDQARLIIHPRGERHMVDPTRLIEGSIGVYGESAFRELYGEIIPVEQDRIDIADDQEQYYLGSRELLFIDTQGHARHHFCIFDPKSLGIFSGDTFGITYPEQKKQCFGIIPTTPPTQFDPDALLKSIDRLLEYQPQWMYLTHYGEVDEPEQNANSLRQWISEYVKLGERIKPDDAESSMQLETELRELISSKLSAQGLSQANLMPLLENDIKLNAQGIAHWWQATHHG